MIDIRTLRIGSHVLANGVVATVERLEMYKFPDGKKRPWGYFHGKVNGEYRECGSFLDVDNVQPIPITSELLKELGFAVFSDQPDAGTTYCKDIGNDVVFFWPETEDLWNMRAMSDGIETGLCTLCRSLHQAECILAPINIELIDD